MTRLNVSKAREEFPEVVNRAAYGKERTIVSRRGKDLAEHPYCERQGKCGRLPASMRLATEVHHKQPVASRPDLRLDPANLEALCHACHSEITAREQGRVG